MDDELADAVADAVTDAIAQALGDPDVSPDLVSAAYDLTFANTDSDTYRAALEKLRAMTA